MDVMLLRELKAFGEVKSEILRLPFSVGQLRPNPGNIHAVLFPLWVAEPAIGQAQPKA